MAKHKLVIIITVVCILSQILPNIAALNILAVISVPLKSHYAAFGSLFRELAVRGHKVTVINNYPDNNPPPNLKFINISTSSTIRTPPISDFEGYATLKHLFKLPHHLASAVENVRHDCRNLLNNNNLKSFRGKGEKNFDVIFVEQFMSDCGLVYAATYYDAPIIGITSHTLLPRAYPRLGIPFDFSSDAFFFSDAGTNPSLYKKVGSYVLNFYMETFVNSAMQKIIQEAFDIYLPNDQFDVNNIAKQRMKMMFVYQHHSITGARLLPPSLLEIAGIHIQKPKPLPKHIDRFISTAKYGVVYISFGSNLKASTMSSDKLQQFLDAFKKIPQKVLWTIENISLPSSNDNVLMSEWFPQFDVLCHPNVLAFVSHGGMLSISEAAHCGTPLLTIPFFGDQHSNSAAVKESGLGTTMPFNQLNSDTLSEAIKLLTSKKMQESAKRVSKLWHDRPQNVMDSAIYWTEYVAKYRDAPPALPSTRSSWLERSLLDVYIVVVGVFLAIILFIFFIIYKIIKLILTMLIKLHSKGKEKRA